ncbi:MAG: thymidine kinase [Myxococcota bacterium]
MIPRSYPTSGWIEVICGCMFSGKTEELLRRCNRARYAKLEVVLFKPSVDVRYAVEDVVSHSDQRLPCIPVGNASEILRHVGTARVVAIDEAQFFGSNLVSVCNQLADDGRQVIVAGLDQDYRGVPFEPIPELLAVAEFVTKALAVCMVCGAPANRSQRLVQRDSRVLLGASESYEARCRAHWAPDSFDGTQEELPLRTD